MGKHSIPKETIRRARNERWSKRWGKIKQWYFTAGTGERRSTSSERDEADGGVGRLSLVRGALPQEVPPKASAPRKAAVVAALLIARVRTYFWEQKVFKGYWDAWANSNEGATEEFAAVLHEIPRIKNNA